MIIVVNGIKYTSVIIVKFDWRMKTHTHAHPPTHHEKANLNPVIHLNAPGFIKTQRSAKMGINKKRRNRQACVI